MIFIAFFYLIGGLRSVEEAFARALVNVVSMMVLFYGNGKILVNRYLEPQKYGAWGALFLLFLLTVSALRAWIEIHIFGGSLFSAATASAGGGKRMVAGYTAAYFLLLIFSTLYQLLENRRELEHKHAEAQLNYLKAQINPHFLFNTLNNIYASATLNHPNTARMVLRLSDLLRYVTYDASAESVPLEKEIAQIHAYIDLFQMRSETLLPITFEMKGDTLPRQIEPLLLIPLIENALKHGDIENNPKGYLRIQIENAPDMLKFSVSNTYSPHNFNKDTMGGVGLTNIQQRLLLKHSGTHEFSALADDAKGVYRVVLSIWRAKPN